MGRSTACLFGAIVILWCCISHVTSDASDHRYKKGDSVPFYANKVGPFHNPRSDFQSPHFHLFDPERYSKKHIYSFFFVLLWGYPLEDEISSGIGCLLVSSQSVSLIYL